jgi:hypothetical protein
MGDANTVYGRRYRKFEEFVTGAGERPHSGVTVPHEARMIKERDGSRKHAIATLAALV